MSQTHPTPKPDAPGLDALNTIEEVAAWVKVSPSTIRRAIASGALAAVRAGSQWRIREQAVWDWLDAGRQR